MREIQRAVRDITKATADLVDEAVASSNSSSSSSSSLLAPPSSRSLPPSTSLLVERIFAEIDGDLPPTETSAEQAE